MGFWNNGGFFRSVKGHVIKWWQFILMPVLKINNNNNNNNNNGNNNLDNNNMALQNQTANDSSAMQEKVMQVESEQHNFSTQKPSKPEGVKNETTGVVKTITQPQSYEQNTGISVEKANGATQDPMEILKRINEEKEESRRREVENAKKKAAEQARIADIMNANKVDVNAFIEAGKAAKEEIALKREQEKASRELAEKKAIEVQQATFVKNTMVEELEKQRMRGKQIADGKKNAPILEDEIISQEEKRKQDEDLRRAQEIMDRLNREAAEDQAKKEAEIEAAKMEAQRKFG